jgi:glycosyltransferase involved in cell wall biosynthesis
LQKGVMKKIGILIDIAYGEGGTFQYNQQILSALLSLPADRYKIIVFYIDPAWINLIPTHCDKRQLLYPRRLKLLYKALFGLGLADSVMRFLFSLSPLRHLADPGYDLIVFPSQDLAGLYLSPKSVNVVHDLMHRYETNFRESSAFGRRTFRDRLFSSMCRLSRLILVDSNVGKTQLLESYGNCKAKIEVLPYIAPSHVVNYDEEPNSSFFEKINLPSKFIFYPAQFWPHKNHMVLLEAANVLKQKFKDLHFVFTGPKKYAYNEIYAYCVGNDLLSHVTFLDYVPNEVLGGFYKRARAMVMPTYYGPTNIPPLEAISVGCPVAVSKIYGMPEQLGDAALYFDNTRVEDVTRTLEQLWSSDDIRKQLRVNAKKHFANWNQKHFNRRFHEIIEEHSTA